MHSIDNRIRSFITESFFFGDTQRGISVTDSLIENDIIDSTGVLELVMFVEEKFGFSVEESEIIPDNFDSIEKIRKYISRKSSEKTAA